MKRHDICFEFLDISWIVLSISCLALSCLEFSYLELFCLEMSHESKKIKMLLNYCWKKYCCYPAEILLTYCWNIAKIKLKYCPNMALTLLNYWTVLEFAKINQIGFTKLSVSEWVREFVNIQVIELLTQLKT